MHTAAALPATSSHTHQQLPGLQLRWAVYAWLAAQLPTPAIPLWGRPCPRQHQLLHIRHLLLLMPQQEQPLHQT